MGYIMYFVIKKGVSTITKRTAWVLQAQISIVYL